VILGLAILRESWPLGIDALATEQVGLDREDLLDVLLAGDGVALGWCHSLHVLILLTSW